MKTFTLSLMFAGLTACGGGGGGGSSKPDSNPIPSSAKSSEASSSAPASSTPSSSAPASSTPASSMAPSSSSASSLAEGSEMTQAATNVNGYAIAKIDNCGVNVSAANKTFAIFADYDGGVQNQSLSSLNFSGWNHSTNENASLPVWKLLGHAGVTYDFSTSAKVNASCNNIDTLNMVMLKKIADWTHQHSNGFERNILSYGYKFSDIENLTVDIKINSAKTSIPSVASLKTTYASVASSSNIDDLEDGKVNIGIVIYDGKSSSTWMAKKIIQLDQTLLADQWVRVVIPMKDMKHCLDENYFCADKSFSELGSKTIAGIQFVAETKTGLVLRNAIDKTWTDNVPETFKETDLSFKKIEFQLK